MIGSVSNYNMNSFLNKANSKTKSEVSFKAQLKVQKTDTPKDGMEAFKKEIYEELDEIYSHYSPMILSDSVTITEGGFKRMKEEPEYRKKIMDWLRADTVASHKLPYPVRAITTIDEYNGKSFGIAADVYDKDESLQTRFEKHDKNAFYRFNNERVSEYRKQQKREEEKLLEAKRQRGYQEEQAYLKACEEKMLNEKLLNMHLMQLKMQEARFGLS